MVLGKPGDQGNQAYRTVGINTQMADNKGKTGLVKGGAHGRANDCPAEIELRYRGRACQPGESQCADNSATGKQATPRASIDQATGNRRQQRGNQ